MHLGQPRGEGGGGRGVPPRIPGGPKLSHVVNGKETGDGFYFCFYIIPSISTCKGEQKLPLLL